MAKGEEKQTEGTESPKAKKEKGGKSGGKKGGLEITLLIGVVVGIGALIMGFIMEEGNVLSLILPSPAVIVFGGTIGAVVASFQLQDIGKALKALMYSFSKKSGGDPGNVISVTSNLAAYVRKEGLLKLEEMMKDPMLNGDEFLLLKEGIVLIMERRSEEEILYVLESDIRSFVTQKQLEISVFEAAGGFSPTMGVIGTVMGLIQVLSKMEDAAKLTASIAVAFVATLYGVAFANMIYIPIANKLKANLKRQKIQKEMIVDGVLMIAKGEASRNIENQLALYYQAFPDGSKKYKQGIEN